MPPIRDECVCIGAWDWSETSQTVRLLARHHGVIRGLAKGSKRERSNFHGGFEPLTRGEVLATNKPPPNLAGLTSWTLLEVFPAVRAELGAFYSGMYAADLVAHMVIDADPHPELYDALVRLLRAVGATPADEHAMIRFQWAVLDSTGHRPELELDAVTREPLATAPTYIFDARLGGVRADRAPPSAGAWRVRHSTLELLRMARDDAAATQAPEGAPHRASRLLHVYAREILGRDIGSARFLFGAIEGA